mmetsp:Transcript_4816/g.11567  ORF Transcript_4816/g.11567 Transcript_4816/m.11567 type:complete len:215 (-) Transcript_4816:199-843(-)
MFQRMPLIEASTPCRGRPRHLAASSKAKVAACNASTGAPVAKERRNTDSAASSSESASCTSAVCVASVNTCTAWAETSASLLASLTPRLDTASRSSRNRQDVALATLSCKSATTRWMTTIGTEASPRSSRPMRFARARDEANSTTERGSSSLADETDSREGIRMACTPSRDRRSPCCSSARPCACSWACSADSSTAVRTETVPAERRMCLASVC